MSLPSYEKYKDSDIYWLGKVPEHWRVQRLKNAADICMGQSLPSEQCNLEGIGLPFLQGCAEFGTSHPTAEKHCDAAPKVAKEGDLLFSVRAPVGKLNVANMNYGIGRGLCAIRPNRGYNPRYLFYWLSKTAYALDAVSTGSTYEAVSVNQVASSVALTPEAGEQLAIADFLDRETAKIDALIAEQQRLIELLQEKRQAVISHAVTKGLNPNAPTKDSGVEWLGEVPEHWDTTPMRRVLIKIEQGWSPECLASPAEESEWGVVKAGCVNGGKFNPLNNKTLPPHLKPPLEHEIQAGDLLMCRASGSPGLIGSAAYIKKVRPRLLLSDKIFRLRTIERVDSRYLADVLSSTPLRQQIRQSISGAVGLANNLPQSEIKDFVVPLPPAKEQDEIHEFLAAETERLKILLDESESLIRLLEERRSALISAAVTGQIDVRGLVEAEAGEQ